MEINSIEVVGLLSDWGIERSGVKPMNVAKIMVALEETFNDNPDEFAKHFGDDVADQEELGGSSWEKLLDPMARDTFRNGFAKIGVTYNSEEEYNRSRNGGDEFKGKLYCRVKTSHKNRTFYYRNDDLIASVIKTYLEKLARIQITQTVKT